MSQPQSAHARMSHTGHIPSALTSHDTGGGRGAYFGSPPHPQSVNDVTHALSNAKIGPSPDYTRGTNGYTPAANATSVSVKEIKAANL